MRMLLGLATLERSTLRFAFAMLILVGAAGTLTSCGGSSGMSKTLLSGNTQVTVELSSTANDQLQSFGLGFQSISLTSQSGKTVSLFSGTQGTEQWAEFIHVNGGAEPLLTLSVPQDIYTAATVQVADSGFTCVTLIPGGGTDTSTFAYGTNPNNSRATTVTVNLPSPITITGNNMGLMLDLLVTQSASYSSCYDASGTYTYAITPTFNLTPVTFSAQPTNAGNGKVLQLYGEITAVGTGSSFTLNLPDTKTLAVAASTSTTYQGISGFSALAAGAFLDMDGTIQPDGSLLATRIEVDDPTAVDVQTGPVMIVGGDPRNGKHRHGHSTGFPREQTRFRMYGLTKSPAPLLKSLASLAICSRCRSFQAFRLRMSSPGRTSTFPPRNSPARSPATPWQPRSLSCLR